MTEEDAACDSRTAGTLECLDDLLYSYAYAQESAEQRRYRGNEDVAIFVIRYMFLFESRSAAKALYTLRMPVEESTAGHQQQTSGKEERLSRCH